MYRNLISKSHIEFKTNKQQDAMDYLTWYLQKEKNFINPNLVNFTHMYIRKCVKCNKMLSFPQEGNHINFDLPTDLNNHVETYSFNNIVNHYFSIRQFDTNCPRCNTQTNHD